MGTTNSRTSLAAFMGVCTLTTVAGAGGGTDIQFVDEAPERGLVGYLTGTGKGGGVAVVDYDEDGDHDLFVPCAEKVSDKLFRNLGDGTFQDIAAQVGLASMARSKAALWLDIDGDHRLDLLVAGDCWEASPSCDDTDTIWLYRQLANGTFIDITADSGFLPDEITGTGIHRGGIAAGDINGDGYLDVAMGVWNGDVRLFLSNGDGTFENVSDSSGVGESSYLWQPSFHDFNGDGLIDMYFAIDFLANRLWINQGLGVFADVAVASNVNSSWNDMGIALGDYDNDGMIDISITEITVGGTHNRLYQRLAPGAGGFTDVSTTVGTSEGDWSWGTILFDADNDGWLDLAVTNGWFTAPWLTDQSRFFHNQGGSPVSFQDESDAVGFNDTYWGSCIIDFDADRDGDLDVVQTCNLGGPIRLLMNNLTGTASTNRYLAIRPRMIAGANHWAIGTTVRIEVGPLSMMRLITAGTSYMGQAPAEAFFGLGAATQADVVTIEWPDGTSRTLHNVTADQVLTVTNTLAEDIDQDGTVGVSDLLALLSAWGPCVGYCPADFDGSGDVNTADLLLLLGAWG